MNNEILFPVIVGIILIIVIIEYALKYKDVLFYLRSGIIVFKRKFEVNQNIIDFLQSRLEIKYTGLKFLKINDGEIIIRDNFFLNRNPNEEFKFPFFLNGNVLWDASNNSLVLCFRMPWMQIISTILIPILVLLFFSFIPDQKIVIIGLVFFIFMLTVFNLFGKKNIKKDMVNYIQKSIVDFKSENK